MPALTAVRSCTWHPFPAGKSPLSTQWRDVYSLRAPSSVRPVSYSILHFRKPGLRMRRFIIWILMAIRPPGMTTWRCLEGWEHGRSTVISTNTLTASMMKAEQQPDSHLTESTRE